MPRCHVCDKLHTSLDEAGYCCYHTACERYAADRAAAAAASVVDQEYVPVDDAARELELLEDQRCGNCGSLFSCGC